jgi:ribonuclease J
MTYAAHEVDHSMYVTCAYEFETSRGRIVLATDLRRHGRLADKTEEFVAAMESDRPEVLLLEGTRLGRAGDVRTTERQARARISELVSDAERRLVIAILNPNNLERLSAFVAAAGRAGRSVVVSPRTMVAIEAIEAALPKFCLGLDGVMVLDPPRSSRPTWHKDLRERHDDRLLSLEQVRREPDRFVLATTAARRPEWIDVDPQGALLIYSASAAYSTEGRGEHEAIRLWARMYDMKVAGLLPNGRVDPFLCPSGHLHEEDLREICERVRPERLIPIHTDAPERFRDLVHGNTRVVLPTNGRSIWL